MFGVRKVFPIRLKTRKSHDATSSHAETVRRHILERKKSGRVNGYLVGPTGGQPRRSIAGETGRTETAERGGCYRCHRRLSNSPRENLPCRVFGAKVRFCHAFYLSLAVQSGSRWISSFLFPDPICGKATCSCTHPTDEMIQLAEERGVEATKQSVGGESHLDGWRETLPPREKNIRRRPAKQINPKGSSEIPQRAQRHATELLRTNIYLCTLVQC